MIRVIIADNHILVREGFKKIINEEVDIEVVCECSNGEEVMTCLKSKDCDVVVLDIDMPGKSGLDLVHDLRSRGRIPRILMQSIHPEDRFAIRALKAGAAGYITKEAAAEELVEAIRKVHAGGVYVSTALAEKIALDLQSDNALAPHERLSDREFQIFRMIASGKSLRDICESLSLSASTINTHRRHIMEKMNLGSNSEIIRYALINQLVD